MDRHSGGAAPGSAPAVAMTYEAGAVAPVRRPWDIFCPITITTAEARRGTTRTLYFHQSDGRLVMVPVTVPAGLGSGMLLTLAGCGGPDPWGRTRGDLLIPIDIVPEQQLEWWGNDARLCVKVTRAELRHGKQVRVDDPLLGYLTFTLAPGSADGARLHWKGRGRGTPPGDLHVRLECLDPAPPSVEADAAAPEPQAWRSAALALVAAIVGVAGLAIGALLLLAR